MSTTDDTIEAVMSHLKLGTFLSRDQLKRVSELMSYSETTEQIAEMFKSDAETLLHSIGTSSDTLDYGSEISDLRILIERICERIPPEIIETVFKICEDNLKSCDVPLEFYLALYQKLCADHGREAAAMIPTLLPFLAVAHTRLAERALLLLVTLLRSSPKTELLISAYLRDLLNKESPEMSAPSFAVLAKSLEMLFPVIPEALTPIYVSELCKQAFLYQGLLLNPEKVTGDLTTAEQLLLVVSLSCLKETARKFNTEHYLALLIAGIKLASHPKIKALSLLCIVKVWSFSAIEKHISMDTLFAQALEMFVSVDSSDAEFKALIEALAYLSLGTAAKTALRASEGALDQLMLMMETTSDSLVIYGCLLVMLNMCRVRHTGQDKDAATLYYLKNMGGDKHSAENDEKATIAFNEALVCTHKVVSTLKAFKHANLNCKLRVMDIVHSLTIKQSVPVLKAIAEQGGSDIVMKHLIYGDRSGNGYSTFLSAASDENAAETRLNAARALANIWRFVDPWHTYSRYRDARCVPFLVELLGPEPGKAPATPFFAQSLLGPTDKLCALLALTNLASRGDEDVHAAIIGRTFEQHLKSLMIDSTVFAFQKAAWELINNLIRHPLMVAKFFNPDSADARRNLDILVKMLHSHDECLQVVLAGLIANATMEFELVSMSILTQEPIFANLHKIVAAIFAEQTQSDDLVFRIATFLERLAFVASVSHPTAMEALNTDEALKSGINAVLASTKNANTMSLLRETIRLAQMKV